MQLVEAVVKGDVAAVRVCLAQKGIKINDLVENPEVDLATERINLVPGALLRSCVPISLQLQRTTRHASGSH